MKIGFRLTSLKSRCGQQSGFRISSFRFEVAGFGLQTVWRPGCEVMVICEVSETLRILNRQNATLRLPQPFFSHPCSLDEAMLNLLYDCYVERHRHAFWSLILNINLPFTPVKYVSNTKVSYKQGSCVACGKEVHVVGERECALVYLEILVDCFFRIISEHTSWDFRKEFMSGSHNFMFKCVLDL